MPETNTQRTQEPSRLRDQIGVLTIAEGFFQSSVLFALINLKVLNHLGDEVRTLDYLAQKTGARPDTLARLLNAGVVLRLLDSKDGVHYALAPHVRSTLSPGAGEGYLGNWIGNLQYLSAALAGLDRAVLASGPTIDPSAHLGADDASTREFILAMHNYAALRGKELGHFLDTSGCGSLLDLGCGPGTYAFHLGMRNPDLKLYLLDLPGVLKVTKEVSERYPLKNEIHYIPADALKDAIPGSYDMVLVSNTLHMLGEKASRQLIKRLASHVNPGGSLVIQAQFLRDDGLGDRWPILLDLCQLCVTVEGRNHSVGETRKWMEDAGFSRIQFCGMSMLNTNSFLRGYR